MCVVCQYVTTPIACMRMDPCTLANHRVPVSCCQSLTALSLVVLCRSILPEGEVSTSNPVYVNSGNMLAPHLSSSTTTQTTPTPSETETLVEEDATPSITSPPPQPQAKPGLSPTTPTSPSLMQSTLTTDSNEQTAATEPSPKDNTKVGRFSIGPVKETSLPTGITDY